MTSACFYGTHNLVLQVFNSDGDFMFTFGSSGEGNGQFNAPTGIAVDSNDNIIVADWGNSRIQVELIKIVCLPHPQMYNTIEDPPKTSHLMLCRFFSTIFAAKIFSLVALLS